MLAEKADTGVFESDAIIRYENGLEQFKTLDPAAIVKHLAYDGTKLAANSKKANGKCFNSFRKTQSTPSLAPNNPGPILGLAMSTLTVLTWTCHQAIHRNEIRSYNGVTLSKRIPWILFYRFPGVFLMTSLLTHLSNRSLQQTLLIGGSMVTMNHFRIRSHVVRSPPYCQFVVNLIVSLNSPWFPGCLAEGDWP